MRKGPRFRRWSGPRSLEPCKLPPVQAPWTFLEADAEERQCFCDAAQLGGLERWPAAPENRYRRVLRLEVLGRTYYLKEFDQTLWKNRLRNRWTQPRSWLDAEREAGVTAWLRERGVPTPRPVLMGSQGARSWYLCAALAGHSLSHWQREGGLSWEELHAAARFLGGALAQGAWLPDASPDHVYLDREVAPGAPDRLALLDFHNGVCGRKPDRKLLRRVLRRFHRFAQQECIPRLRAMRFAAQLLRSAGLQGSLRRLLEGLAPLDTHGRYEVAGRSGRYRRRNPKRAAREAELLEAVWIGKPGDRVLDAPTGTGRLLESMAQRQGLRMVGSDRAWAMLREARARCPGVPLIQSDALGLGFLDRSFEGVIVFRFLHHLEESLAKEALREASRLAQDYVLVTFFHPYSLHACSRRLKELLRGRARTRFGLRPSILRCWMGELGFELVHLKADAAYRKDLWMASFRRVGGDSSAS